MSNRDTLRTKERQAHEQCADETPSEQQRPPYIESVIEAEIDQLLKDNEDLINDLGSE